MTRSSVDLPLPLGPSSAVSEPASTSIETSSSALEVAEPFRDVADARSTSGASLLRPEQSHGDEHEQGDAASASEMPYAPAWFRFS